MKDKALTLAIIGISKTGTGDIKKIYFEGCYALDIPRKEFYCYLYRGQKKEKIKVSSETITKAKRRIAGWNRKWNKACRIE